MPWLVLLPDSIDQIQAILRLCHRLGMPVVARGQAPAFPAAPCRWTTASCLPGQIQPYPEIDPANRSARVEPGCATWPFPKPRRLTDCTTPRTHRRRSPSIGGNIAENSGGVHCLKYGLTTHNLLQVKLLTMDGEMLDIGGSGLDGPGYDLLALVTGSEGMLGIIVEATVKLLPIPEHTQVVMAAFDSIEQAGAAVAGIIAAGMIPAGLEMMDKTTMHAAEAFVHAGYPLDAAAILLCELDGGREQVEEELAQACRLLQESGAEPLQGRPGRTGAAAVLGRPKSAFPAVGRISPTTIAWMAPSPPTPGQHAERDRRVIEAIWPDRGQCLPCRRRQPAPTDFVRRRTARRNAKSRTAWRRHSP